MQFNYAGLLIIKKWFDLAYVNNINFVTIQPH